MAAVVPDSDEAARARRAANRWPRGLNLLITIACVVVIVAGLRAAATFFVPVSVAALLALTALPLVRRLQRSKVPEGLAIFAVLAVVVAAVLIVPVVVGVSVTQFRQAIPSYRAKLQPLFETVAGGLRDMGFDVPAEFRLSTVYDSGALLGLIADATGGLVAVLSNVLVVLLVTIFMLFEARGLPAKLHAAFERPDAARTFEQIIDRTGRYISVKAAMSLLTGAAVWLLNAVVGVDFALLWGFVAFAFNFIPNIGSILAAIPAILLAWIEFGLGTAGLVTAGYLVINVSISNGLEPHVMGARLGLSTLVVFLSLFFWFWVWGPVGMLLSVPLTVILKISLEHSEQFRPIAVLLGRSPPAPAGSHR